MRAIVTAASLALLLASPQPAAAWDPFADDRRPRRATPPPVQAPVPPPLVVPVPPGIYRVTDVYVGNVVTRSGPLTTYTTTTARQDPGTYARVLETVATGRTSAYDGNAFNGRASLSDGRPIAGTYYENFVLTRGRFVPVSVVFFQDDRELAAQRRPAATPAVRAPAATPFPLGSWKPIPAAAARPAPRPTPVRTPTPAAPAVPAPPAWTPAPAPVATPRVPVIVPGVATSPLGGIAGTLVVLRGRPVDLWVRATVDGRTVSVSGWRIVAGEHVPLGPTSGAGGEPFRARWDRVTPPGAVWTAQVEATVHVGGVAYTARGDVRLSVRSPALIR